MSIWGKLFSAVKGHVNTAAENIQDSNLMVILEQEIREAKEAIAKAKDERARMTANRVLKERSVAELESEVHRRTDAARTAKSTGDEVLAVEIIESILKLKEKSISEQDLADQYKATEEKMDASIRQSQSRIENLNRKIESAKATEALIHAQKASSTSTVASNGKLASAVDSLDRLEQRQAHQQAMLEAAEQEARVDSGADLEEKIKRLERPGQGDVQKLLEAL
ncbi:PspA/IM30 family protein [Pseudovibrio axinellae]|uniref:PspA/IM30 family protein n=1 Tax=Pseudovibrio axinellae TaxID=989403 RepID=A0A165WRH1_9HYPH|nr:PspA/IM30 family protein [Pseudovibrio axinellae]KZL16814.1 PspA/IM30 family protein [Pseudovibrio axinellae]SER68212.1 phage shock protein A (PspA) family protein [Pseudovibrio axinellae]